MTTKNYNKGFTPINKVIGNSAKNYNLENALHKHQALKHWEVIAAGFIEGAENLTKALDFKKGVLTIACLSKEVAYKVKFMAERLISALNEVLGKRLIYAIYVEF